MELKPCPFCGREAWTRTDLTLPKTFDARVRVGCDTIGCRGFYHASSGYYASEAAAADAWNTRAEFTCHNDNHETWNEDFICSECGVIFCQDDGEYYGPHLYMPFSSEGVAPSYCPNCGARVVNE